MRLLPPPLADALARGTLDAVWFARIEWTRGPMLLATRPARLDGVECAPRLLDPPKLELDTRRPRGLPVLGIEHAELRMQWRGIGAGASSGAGDGIGGGDPEAEAEAVFLAPFREESIEGRPLAIGVAALPPAPAPAPGAPPLVAEAEVLWLFRGILIEMTIAGLSARVEARGWTTAAAARRIPEPLPPEFLARHGLDSRLRVIPPLLFGRLEACPLSPWGAVRLARVVHDITYKDTLIYIDDATSWPPAGRAQVADEVFAYAAVDHAAGTLGSPGAPLSRPEARAHCAGTRVAWLAPGGPAWLVAGHPCARVDRLCAEGRPVTASTPSIEQVEVAEDTARLPAPRRLALLRLDRFPVLAEWSTEPAMRTVRGRALCFKIRPGTTALDAQAAFDDDPASAARLDTAHARLRLGMGFPVGRVVVPHGCVGDRLYGRFDSLVVEIVMAADRVWKTSSRPRVFVRRGEAEWRWEAPRPDPAFHVARVEPPLYAVTMLRAAALESQWSGSTSVPRFSLRLDLTDAAQASGGWRFFRDEDGNTPELDIVFDAPGDPAVLAVHEIILHITYIPMTRCRIVTNLTADVEGRPDPEGRVIENPVEALRELLVAPDLGARDPQAPHAPDWNAERLRQAARGAVVRRRVAQPVALDHLVEEIAAEAGLCLADEATRIRLRPLPAAPTREQAEAALDAAAFIAARCVAPPAESGPLHEVEVLAPASASDSDGVSGANARRLALAVAPAPAPPLPPLVSRRMVWVARWWPVAPAGLRNAARLAALVLERRRATDERIEIELPPTRAVFERGDIVRLLDPIPRGCARDAEAAETPDGPGSGQGSGWNDGAANERMAEIEAIAFEAGRMRLRARLFPAVRTLWESPEGAARVELERPGLGMRFVVEGRVVLRIGPTGDLRAAGVIYEQALTPHPATGAFYWDGATRRLELAAGEGTDRRALAALDVQGRLFLTGEIKERAALDVTDAPEGIFERAGDLLAAPAPGRVAMRLRAADAQLQIAGAATENATVG